jgi:hypothetical protein
MFFTLCNGVAVNIPPPCDYFYMIAYAFRNDLAAYSQVHLPAYAKISL